jgi:histidinol-phosphate phosphatase family protein
VRNKRIEKVIFLDRDGVLIHSIGNGKYVKEKKEVRIIKVNIEFFRKLSVTYEVTFMVVTNQAGVEKGLISIEDVEAVNLHISSIMMQNQIRIEKFYVCPHKQETDCRCRKPKPGLLERAIRDYSLIPSKCLMIGDRETDLLAGNAMGIKSFLLDYRTTSSERRVICNQITTFLEN